MKQTHHNKGWEIVKLPTGDFEVEYEINHEVDYIGTNSGQILPKNASPILSEDEKAILNDTYTPSTQPENVYDAYDRAMKGI